MISQNYQNNCLYLYYNNRVTPENMHMLNVVAGTVNLTNLNTASKHDLTEILIHEEYDEIHDWNNDIALLKVRF